MIHLTGQNFTPKELIQNVFSPMIGVITSAQSDEICQKNNLSFVELLQPFCRLSNDVYMRDPVVNTVNTIKGIHLNICDVTWRPPQTLLARKFLNECVTSAQCERMNNIKIDDGFHIDIPSNELWFELWREMFLTIQFPSDHEFTRHFLSCLIVVSTSDTNPVECAHQLTNKIQMMQNVTPPKLPKWVTTDALNCYVLIHDVSIGDLNRAQQAYESLKLTFGDNRCFLLQINSNSVAGEIITSTHQQQTDIWFKYLRKQPKSDQTESINSAPRTPQDFQSVTTMPMAVQMSSLETITPPSGIIGEEVVDHPLSPIQEHAIEAIHSNLSTSTDSLTSQLPVVNPNVWANENTDLHLPHGQFLSQTDLDNLKHFIHDFAVRSLVPFAERLIATLNDTVSNKKGVSRSLLSATKRWFVTNKPGANTMQNAVVYTSDSIELQTRKLGDLYFMFGNYNLAFQAYHQAKRDFNADSAWQYYAGALEMAALSAFMLSTSNRKTYDYMEEAIVTYLNICKLPQFATRATLLSVICLKSVKLFAESAKQLIRMTSEDSDLRSALLLEQASYCFLCICQSNQQQQIINQQQQQAPFQNIPITSNHQPQYRKYAFHIVLAGHRFSKANQRKHAFRCYKQAYQVFENRGWSLAEDHIQYTIGKQAVTLKKLDEASMALAHLLRPSSLQSVTQQTAFLREYITTQKTLLNQLGGGNSELLNLSLPRILSKSIRVLVTSHPPVSIPNFVPASNISITTNLADEWKWEKLEEIAVQFASAKQIMIFKPTRSLFTYEQPAHDNPLSVYGEPIEVYFILQNTIKPSIIFEDINLLWTFTKDNGEIVTNKNLFKSMDDMQPPELSIIHDTVIATYVKLIQLNEHEEKTITIKLTPKFTGSIKIDGVVGKISIVNEPSPSVLWGKLSIDLLTLKSAEQQQMTVAAATAASQLDQKYDKKLEIQILPQLPALHVNISQIPYEILAGEIIPITIQLTNAGIDSIMDIYLVTETPRWIIGDEHQQELPLSVLREFRDLTNETLSKDKESRKQYACKLLTTQTSNTPSLKSTETKIITIWFQAPLQKGQTDVKLLFYYSVPNGYVKIKYRLLRHQWHFNVNESISVEANCNISNMLTNELGIDLSIVNLNQVHHPIMSEIFLNEISLYCPVYKINSNKILYLYSPGYIRIFEENAGLRKADTLNLRVSLINDELSASPAVSQKPLDINQFISKRLSKLIIKTYDDELLASTKQKTIPQLINAASFLMKNETKFIGVFGQSSGGTEEFNNIILNDDKHMTIIVTWKACVRDNNSVQRITYGQHFIQLRNLYEIIHCPLRDKVQQVSFGNHEQLHGIYNFKESIKTQDYLEDSDNNWEFSNISVATRCVLEVEHDNNEYTSHFTDLGKV